LLGRRAGGRRRRETIFPGSRAARAAGDLSLCEATTPPWTAADAGTPTPARARLAGRRPRRQSSPVATKRSPAGPAIASARRGLWLMLAASLAFAAMSACVKTLRTAGFGTAELIFYRTVLSLPALWWALQRRGASLRPGRWEVIALRS